MDLRMMLDTASPSVGQEFRCQRSLGCQSMGLGSSQTQLVCTMFNCRVDLRVHREEGKKQVELTHQPLGDGLLLREDNSQTKHSNRVKSS